LGICAIAKPEATAKLAPRMRTLSLLGALCFAVSFALPSFRSSGFLSIGGRGWKIFLLAYLLAFFGVMDVLKGSGNGTRHPFLALVPALLNTLAIALLIAGLLEAKGPVLQGLAITTLIFWALTMAVILRKSWDDLQIGAVFWSAGLVLLSIAAFR
jgi:hypothetical protein